MTSMFSEILEVKSFLQQQHISVSEEWTEACIGFVKQEQVSSLPLQNLKKSVYQQWLVADLEEISCPSLPPQLPTQQKISLKNNFALQIQGIRDISRPAYSQLKQIEGSINSNAEFSSAPQAALPDWEAKPTRMLMLNLTDGCTHIQGMEYRPINFLSPNLHPGIKVLIKGLVECRFGVLLLLPENIRILGGEVESKLQQFSRESMLKAQLQLSESGENEDTSPVFSISNQVNQELTNQSPRNQEPSRSTNDSQLNSYNDSNQASSSRTSSNTYSNRIQRNQNNVRNSWENDIPEEILLDQFEEESVDLLDNFGNDDDFEQNIDYDKIDEIENTQRQINEQNMPIASETEHELWDEDEDVVRDMMEFQDRNQDFDMQFETSAIRKIEDNENKPVFTYLSTVANISNADCVITIKGFIITVLSKLECTSSKGWGLLVKINDGTASIDANIHDKVLENIIGVSAQDMMKKQVLANKNPVIRKEIMEAISNCKSTLQNYNCLMDVKFTPSEKPSIIKCSSISVLQLQQMLERIRSSV